MMSKDIDCSFTDNIVCPYCGEENQDSWEVRYDVNEGDLGVIDCGYCDKKFNAERMMTINYSSSKAPCLNEEGDHEWEAMIGAPKEFFENKFVCKICGLRKHIEKVKKNDI